MNTILTIVVRASALLLALASLFGVLSTASVGHLAYLQPYRFIDAFLVCNIAWLLIIGLRILTASKLDLEAFEGKKKFFSYFKAFLGVLLFSSGLAYSSSNVIGYFVNALPNKSYQKNLILISSGKHGSKHAILSLKLKSTNGNNYSINLSKKRFDYSRLYDELKEGDKVLLIGRANIFGALISEIQFN